MWLQEILKHYFTFKTNCWVIDNTVIVYENNQAYKLELRKFEWEDNYILYDREYYMDADGLIQFLCFASHINQIPYVTNMENEICIVLRQQNQMTFPKRMLDRLDLPPPGYGLVVKTRITGILTREGQWLDEEQIRKKLEGGKKENV